MVSIITIRKHNKELHEVRLLSTDAKPTNVANGSECIEIDTGKVYLFDADGKQWHEI